MQLGLSPLFEQRDHFPTGSQESSGCYWNRSVIRHIWCSECTWCNFKACLTVWVCAHSASPRQPHAWHKADRHCRTESLLQKQAFNFIFFFQMKAWEEEEKSHSKPTLKFLTLGAHAGNVGRREHRAKGGGESFSIQGYIFRLLLILFCHCAAEARPVWINAAQSFLIFAQSRLQS